MSPAIIFQIHLVLGYVPWLPQSSSPANAGHPRSFLMPAAATWMAGPSPAMTTTHEPAVGVDSFVSGQTQAARTLPGGTAAVRPTEG
jgi:hypothetical protein